MPAGSLLPMASAMRSDCTCIHCDNLTEDEWRLIASTDGHVSMRTAFTLQRMQVLARERAGEKRLPALLTVREVVAFATGERRSTFDVQRVSAERPALRMFGTA